MTRPAALLPTLLLPVLFPVLLAATASAVGAAGPPLPDNALAGRPLFESKQCGHCHGLSGIRPGIAWPRGVSMPNPGMILS